MRDFFKFIIRQFKYAVIPSWILFGAVGSWYYHWRYLPYIEELYWPLPPPRQSSMFIAGTESLETLLSFEVMEKASRLTTASAGRQLQAQHEHQGASASISDVQQSVSSRTNTAVTSRQQQTHRGPMTRFYQKTCFTWTLLFRTFKLILRASYLVCFVAWRVVQLSRSRSSSKHRKKAIQKENKTTVSNGGEDGISDVFEESESQLLFLLSTVLTSEEVLDSVFHLLIHMGPTYVKLGQWIASRPDLFPHVLIQKLSKLFDAAPPHSWSYTQKELQKSGLLGTWIEEVDTQPINSGSVAQVHQAKLVQPMTVQVVGESIVGPPLLTSSSSAYWYDRYWRWVFEKILGICPYEKIASKLPEKEVTLQKGTPVVVKILHPHAQEYMIADLYVLRCFARFSTWLIPDLKYFSIVQNANEFSALLLSQLDLRREGDNLLQFRYNFLPKGGRGVLPFLETDIVEGGDRFFPSMFSSIKENIFGSAEGGVTTGSIVFPLPIPSLTTSQLLIETFEAGISLQTYLAEENQRQKRWRNFDLEEKRKYNGGEKEEIDDDDEKGTCSPMRMRLANLGCHMFLKMLFEDNFIHSDLHLGNILVRFKKRKRGEAGHPQQHQPQLLQKTENVIMAKSWEEEDHIFVSRLPSAQPSCSMNNETSSAGGDNNDGLLVTKERRKLFLENENKEYSPELVILDPGLVTTLSQKERSNFIALFGAVACGDGQLGAKLMLERAPDQACTNEKKFFKDMQEVFDAVKPPTVVRDEEEEEDHPDDEQKLRIKKKTQQQQQKKKKNNKSHSLMGGFTLRKIDLGKTMTKIFDTMREHRVRIDGNFASLVASVIVGEGLGREMHPDFNIFSESVPYLTLCLKHHELFYLIDTLWRVYAPKQVKEVVPQLQPV